MHTETELYPNPTVANAVHKYCIEHSLPVTTNTTPVLEIGCFTGYSAPSFAHALRCTPSASITTLDLPGPHTTLARPATASLAHLSTQKAYYDLIFLDANKDQYTTYLNLILSLKLLSPRAVILCDNVLKMGLVADSTENNPAARKEVRGEGEGYDDGYGGSTGGKERVDHLRQAEWLDGFNKAVKGDERVECVVLPVFDGLSFIRLRDGQGGLDGREKLV
ncbi:S-adenosyl-L-methionine-dependent methyltransferase [Tirmania nivea]|nr:S-adenosyl-L-methionine-dependent methyltransferase [Tirmania nivea]